MWRQRADLTTNEKRGVLYIGSSDEPFRIRKGERFQMIRLSTDSLGCRIRLKDKEHDPSSCPWSGANYRGDLEADIYRVISGQVKAFDVEHRWAVRGQDPVAITLLSIRR